MWGTNQSRKYNALTAPQDASVTDIFQKIVLVDGNLSRVRVRGQERREPQSEGIGS